MRLLSKLCICLVAVALTGCAGYHLGSAGGERAGEKSVQIVPFSNQTVEPWLTDAVTTALRHRVQQDGTYRLATHNDGDVVLTGRITRFDRNEVSLNPQDSLTVRDYRINLYAEVTARSRSTDEVLFAQTVKGYTTVRVGSDLVSAERQALPLAATDLAKNAVSLLTEGKWW